ncbi:MULTISPECIES: SpoIVB peptidase [Anaerotruncus]|jgi:stage IV sporulation protein B|uniref:SpoIVB peptidase n=1 Tax=Anaerotruncus TaxID=244127 RepID=UPI00082F6E22|nr:MULTISPECIES: SpoIVB peptidase [Anaerotruncus]RGX56685.1 SpoIVB peptidase [Anaerotruncus sp. AF02-27]
MRKQYQRFAGALSLAIVAVQSIALYTQAILPDHYYVVAGETLSINSTLPIKTSSSGGSLPVEAYSSPGNSYNVDLKLPYGIEVKQVQVQVVDREMVVPGGNPFGIKMFTEGVLVVGMSDIASGGTSSNPAKAAGLKVGDIIKSIDGRAVQTNEDVGAIVSSCAGNPVKVSFERAGTEMSCFLNPVQSDDGTYRAGIWVRDSSAGIGTMTYYNPINHVFAGLGHAICDVDTGDIMPLHSGEIVDVNITGVHRGESGLPGELRGSFSGQKKGELLINSQVGIFGVGTDIPSHSEAIPLAMRYEVTEGPATIWCTLDDGDPKEYTINIEKVSIAENNPTKNMVIRVVDPELLTKTGGIVQGMSGSPIVQNNKLVGAVTHVFVNDPTRGYGIFAENMDKMSKNVENTPKK